MLGGGVMRQAAPFDPIRDGTADLLAGYAAGGDRTALAFPIAPAGCGEPPRLIGAYLSAERTLGDCGRSETS